MPTFAAADGTPLHYTDEGSGPVLLCLAGLTRTGRDFDYLAPHLPPLRHITLDCRGRGASGWSGAASYTLPQESQDVIGLLDHLGLDRVAVLGTSRGGLIGLGLAALMPGRISGLCLNDIGPALERVGLERIFGYIGHNPAARTHAEFAAAAPTAMAGFADVPSGRWLEEAQRHYRETEQGLQITYDPSLRESFLEGFLGDLPDMWPLFDALPKIPLALIRGANSDLISEATAAEMQRRRPSMIWAEVPDRAHVPFLDEPASLAAIRTFLGELS